MVEVGSPTRSSAFGARSRALSRGAIGEGVDGRSREGRFLRQAERALLDQIGGEASFTQRTLIRRAARLMLAAEALDGSLGAGEVINANQATTLGQLNGSLLDVLRELGVPQASPSSNPPQSKDRPIPDP